MPSAKTTALKKFTTRLWRFLISNVGAFVIGFSALLIAVYQFYINRPLLRYDTLTHSFISSLNQNHFKVLIENQAYDDLYQTVVILKNNGQQPLDGDDVSKIGHDPIRIIVPKSAEMVHFTLDQTLTSPAVSVKTSLYHGDIILKFDYLNPDDQIAVTILHQKPDTDFRVVGSALGVTSIQHEWTDKEIFNISLGALIGLYILTVLLEYLDRKGFL